MKFKDIVMAFLILSLIPIGFIIWFNNKVEANLVSDLIEDKTLQEYVYPNISEDEFIEMVDTHEDLNEYIEEDIEDSNVCIAMNFVGDCTIGSDSNFGYNNTFFNVYDREQDYGYFFSNMQDLFLNDDLTIANFEGTLTDYTVKTPKEFNFRAPPHYANILLSGDIDAVNLANNHTKDYGQTGYNDTLKTLEEKNIPYFGYDNYYIYEKDGIKIGFAGLTAIWDGTIEQRIDNALSYFRENECNSTIFTFHWGNERVYKQNIYQVNVAHYAIDHGADLVVGHHPHVLQGIEKYNGKYIVYSLGNFCFGGNTNPPDKDTMIFNIIFEYEDGKLINTNAKVYPAKVSSVSNKNDFKPTLAEGEEYYRILNKISKYSNVEFDDFGKID